MTFYTTGFERRRRLRSLLYLRPSRRSAAERAMCVYTYIVNNRTCRADIIYTDRTPGETDRTHPRFTRIYLSDLGRRRRRCRRRRRRRRRHRRVLVCYYNIPRDLCDADDKPLTPVVYLDDASRFPRVNSWPPSNTLRDVRGARIMKY